MVRGWEREKRSHDGIADGPVTLSSPAGGAGDGLTKSLVETDHKEPAVTRNLGHWNSIDFRCEGAVMD